MFGNVGRERDALLRMDVDAHFDAAALCQARASNPENQRDLEVSAAQEARAQTHLLWAVARMLYEALPDADDTTGGAPPR